MAFAIVVVLLVVGSVLFHFWSPWWFTPIASNWGDMDATTMITFWVTGVVFVAVNFFVAYCVYKFRHSDDRRAAYEPENKKLEGWLTGVTALGVFAMLAPGLIVYSDFVEVPQEVVVFEAVGQQWQWSFRYPGEDGVLGQADNRNITAENPLGIDLQDANGNDDIVVLGAPAHIELDRPVKINLRSRDVLHDFYVPQFRAKMDLVPGLVSYFWMTPTRTGTFEILCAELCGVGHYIMRSEIIVDEPDDYRAWLSQQMTAAQLRGGGAATVTVGGDQAERGREIARVKGCVACHSTDGSKGLGPSWKGMYGRTETLVDGSTVVVDDEYIRESIREPNAKLVEGYAPVMITLPLTDDEIDALIALAKALSE
ncbi:MAG: c-type cytochrome [Pseudomonadales bacterium]|jgi:cytochrome c oxidase subunit 2|nr:c-type cytochrome [Pseudomonadales bacterium]MDP7597072.1 c-type cytochrome [Pseudomonadales bacterium]HJN53203.1 c-type cytochrome [Pseudomonadales bacterium]